MTDTRGSIYPADQLLAWLERHKSDIAKLGGTELRLPVLVTLTANKMDVKTATVGDRPDALSISVDDRTLGIPIAGKLPMFYGEGSDTGMLWLHGLWRGGQDKEFQVTTVEGPIAVADRASATTAEIVK